MLGAFVYTSQIFIDAKNYFMTSRRTSSTFLRVVTRDLLSGVAQCMSAEHTDGGIREVFVTSVMRREAPRDTTGSYYEVPNLQK